MDPNFCITTLYRICLWTIVKNGLPVGLIPIRLDDHIKMIKSLYDVFNKRKKSYNNYCLQIDRLCELTTQMDSCFECGLNFHWLDPDGQCFNHAWLMSNALYAQNKFKFEYETVTSVYREEIHRCEKVYPELLDMVKTKIEAGTSFEIELWWEI